MPFVISLAGFLFWFYHNMPETNGKTIMQIEEEMRHPHTEEESTLEEEEEWEDNESYI